MTGPLGSVKLLEGERGSKALGFDFLGAWPSIMNLGVLYVMGNGSGRFSGPEVLRMVQHYLYHLSVFLPIYVPTYLLSIYLSVTYNLFMYLCMHLSTYVSSIYPPITYIYIHKYIHTYVLAIYLNLLFHYWDKIPQLRQLITESIYRCPSLEYYSTINNIEICR